MAGTTFAVGLEFNAKTQSLDAAYRKLNAVNAAAGKTGGAANNIRKFGAASQAASIGVRGLGAAFSAALGPIGALLSATALLSKGFQTLAAQDFAEAKVRTLGVNSQELVGNLKAVSAELKGQASVAELTAASYDVASAGFNTASEASKVLKAAAQGAVGGFTDMNTAGNALTSVLNAYGLSADHATSVMDQFIQTQNDGKIVVAEYAANIGKVASAAAALSIPLAEVNAAIAQSTASGVQADVAFTGLKGALARLASGEAAKALEGTGLSIDAASLAADGLIGTLKKMKAAGLDTGQIFKALGTEAAPALLPLLNNLEKTDELLKNQANSAGVAGKAMGEAANTIQGAWKNVQTQIENFFSDQSALGEALKLTLNFLAQILKDLGDRINFLLGPFKQVLQVVSSVASFAQKLGQSFQEAFAQSEGAQALQALFEEMQGVLAGLASFAKSALAPVLEGTIQLAAKVASMIGTTIYNAIQTVVHASVGLLKIIPGMGGLATSIEAAWGRVVEKVNAAKDGVEKSVPKQKELTDETDKTKRNAEQLKEAQAGVTKAIQEAVKAADAQAQVQGALLDQQTSVLAARLEAETAINGVLLQQAERQLAAAQTQEDRIVAAQAIYDLTVRQAELERSKTQAEIAAATQRATLAQQSALLKEKEVEAVVRLAEAQGVVTEAHYQALEAQRQATQIAGIQLQTAAAVAKEQLKAADALYKGKVEAAELQRQSNLAAQSIQQGATGAAQLAANLGQAAANASKIQSAGSSGAWGGSGTGRLYGVDFGPAGKNAAFEAEVVKKMEDIRRVYRETPSQFMRMYTEAMNEFRRQATVFNNNLAKQQLSSAKTELRTGMRGYASGGYVTGPEMAMIGEGGEPEYIIPASKMQAAMANYASGRRGDAVVGGGTPQVNIQTGPVTQMNGTNYLTMKDAQRIASDATQQTLNILRRDPAVRRSIGVTQ